MFLKSAKNILNEESFKVFPVEVDSYYRSEYSEDDNLIDNLNGIDNILNKQKI